MGAISKLKNAVTKNPAVMNGFNTTGLVKSGAAGSRTLVQTNSPNAFYMLIPALIVGK